MFNTFNMGVGMVLTVPAEQADKALEILHADGGPRGLPSGRHRRRRGCGAVLNIAVLVSGGGTNLQALLDS